MTARRVDLPAVDQQGMVTPEPPSDALERGAHLVAVDGAREVGVGLVDEGPGSTGSVGWNSSARHRCRAQVGSGQRSRQQPLLFGLLDEGLAQEGLVGGVLEQAADQVGHARHDLTDGHVLAHAQPHLDDGVLDGLGHAVEHLDFECVRRADRPLVAAATAWAMLRMLWRPDRRPDLVRSGPSSRRSGARTARRCRLCA